MPGVDKPPTQPPSGARRPSRPEPELLPAGLGEWSERDDDECRTFIEQLDTTYYAIVDGFLDDADRFVDLFRSLGRSYKRWRIGLILATGFLAVINVLAAFNWGDTAISRIFSLSAAVYAALLVLFSNLESLHNYRERSEAFRESRELALDSYREFDMLWHIHVRAFSYSPEACVNASLLYRRLVARDRELRAKIKEWTQTKPPEQAE